VRYLTFASSGLGESPPPRPRACFGRDEIIKKVVGLAKNLTPVALIGAGGIGKTSIALTILHDNRIKQRFGKNRRFIRCDQFPASRTHFLSRLSKVVGAGVENPEDLTPLRPFLSSKEVFIVLDNAESILDPQGTGALEIYTMVEELSQFETICLCITSRITTVPRHCKRMVVPTLSMEAACDIFYGIYDDGGRSDVVSGLLHQLDFHALSIELLATTASHNMWDYGRLIQEWDTRRTQVLQTDYSESLAATIELSLTSPMFRKLGSEARDLLGVIAFFPRGVDENNLDWLFPTISDRKNIFDKFCVLSLTYRSDGFFTMLAPLRDYLCPKDPTSSPLIAIKGHYLRRLSVHVNPGRPGYEEARWITSEDVNVEHLLDVFTSVDANSDEIWGTCAYFMEHLYWHKNRLIVLGPKFEGLPDSHPSKPTCLFRLSLLFDSVGNQVERKRLLIHTLKLWRERGDDVQVAQTLMVLASTNEELFLPKEGIAQAKESLEICKRLNNVSGQARALLQLARLLCQNNQLDAAEEAASRSTNLLPDTEKFEVCQGHLALGEIYRTKGEAEKAINHFETALGIADSFDWHAQQSRIHYFLARLFRDQGRLDDAYAHIERAKSHTANDAYGLGRVMELKAMIWYKQGKIEEAKSETLDAVGVFEKLGAAMDLERCRNLLRDIEEKAKGPVTSGKLCFNGDILETMLIFCTYQSSTLRLGNRVMSPTIVSTSTRPLSRTNNPTQGWINPVRRHILYRSYPPVFSFSPMTPCIVLVDLLHPRAVPYLCPTTRPLIYFRCCIQPPMLSVVKLLMTQPSGLHHHTAG
jgi:tetratricopeptide (TPR) repeat protein